MIKRTSTNISFFQSDKLADYPEIIHFFSTRNSGVSKDDFDSLNFGTHHGEEGKMKTNINQLADVLNLESDKFVIPKQTHGDNISIIDELNYTQVFENTDALLTNIPTIILAIKTADCVPILLFDPIKKVIGAVHSGWRGTVQNIVGKTITKMNRNFGSDPATILAAIGPCIGTKNYEVGNEVIQKFKSTFLDNKTIFKFDNAPKGKAFLNLTQANSRLLIQAGMIEKNIESSGLCTYSMKDDFFSARRDGTITGRMINGISIRVF